MGSLPGKLRSRVLSVICPTPEEIRDQRAAIDTLRQALELRADNIGQSYSFIEAQGSTGKKQTQLAGISDIDLFVGLRVQDFQDIFMKDPKERHKHVGKVLDSLVDDWFIPAVQTLEATNVQKTYSQHPYLSLTLMGLDVDILSCFDISAEAIANDGPITAVDRTVHHSNFVAENLTPEKREDVRLLKSFVRACHAYGDDCAIGRMGFTGYSLELLVLDSDSFADAIRRIARLRVEPLDPKGRSVEKLRSIPSFRDDYILIIDPTDHGRNVASSFDERAVRWVQHKARQVEEYLERGILEENAEILIEEAISEEPLPESVRNHALSFEFLSDATVHYTVQRDKLYRLARRISSQLEREETGEVRFGRSLAEVYFEGTRFALGIFVQRASVSEDYVRQGPPVEMKDAAERFIQTHPGAFEDAGRLWAEVTRKWTDAGMLAKYIIRHHSIKGLTLVSEKTAVSRKALRALYEYVLHVEKDFTTEE
ncbi:MAG: hypothetical protein JSW61_12780 [Candidatus Thorarchaeota archaeon]|nr:MAG: hypothetical protein JSW61_12780 [Candidatus Thorarchaeota archaeon]